LLARCEVDRAAVGIDDIPGDREAETVAFSALVETQTALAEPRRLLGRDTGTIVLDADLDSIADAHPDVHLGSRPFGRVLEQVSQQLQQIVGDDRGTGLRRRDKLPVEPRALRGPLQRAQQSVNGFDHVGMGRLETGTGAQPGTHQLALDPPPHGHRQVFQVIGQGCVALLAQALRIGDQRAERGLEAVGQIRGPGPRALDRLLSRLQECIDLPDQGHDLVRIGFAEAPRPPVRISPRPRRTASSGARPVWI
jgi:hypothetical protein